LRGVSRDLHRRLRRGKRHPGAEAEQALTGPGTIGRFVAPGSVTQGRFGLYEWRMAAGAGRADPPFHRNFSESFYVLSGTVRLYDGGSWIDASAGDFLHVPDLLPRARRHLQQRTVLSDEEWTDLFARHDQYRAT
jgi:mannose-6-phosphate isomerase-like protein (cupin superfamily)